MRINFLPTIEMIKQRFDVIEVDHGTDYRLRTLEKMEISSCRTTTRPSARWPMDFRRIAASEGRGGSVEIRAQHRRGAPGPG